MKLAEKKLSEEGCVPCQNATAPVKGVELKRLSNKLGSGWKIVRGHHLEREYKFKDFLKALAFTNKVGKLAERVQHHPDIYLAWGKVKLTLWTHKIDGLTESDFVFAAKVNKLG
ncbi:MAG: 4a-hydroxytetrahydrobiopterin dehydratase [Verrucomicrobiota bacterium]